jgi:transposase
VFGEAPRAGAEAAIDVKTLHAKIGELTLENDFLSGALGKAGLFPSAKR